MSGLEIPTKPMPNVLEYHTTLDSTILSELPVIFKQNGAASEINHYIQNINARVEKYVSDAEFKKQTFVQDIKNTHEQLENTLAEFLKNRDSEVYEVTIIGVSLVDVSELTDRTIDLWNNYNHGKSLAITNFVNELKYKGWDPQVVLSEVHNDYCIDLGLGGYSGGENIIVSCNFGALDQ